MMPSDVRADMPVSPADRTGMPRPRTYDDWPTAASGLPVRTTTPPPHGRPHGPTSVPRPASGVGTAGTQRLYEFTNAVLGLHRVLADRFIPMCSCGLPARHCPIVKAEHDVLGMAMPFEFGPLTHPLYYEV